MLVVFPAVGVLRFHVEVDIVGIVLLEPAEALLLVDVVLIVLHEGDVVN